MRSTFGALQVRNYRLFATGSLVSNVGTWMQRVAQDWLILTLTASAGALGITTGLQFLPILLFSPFAGVIADRYPKRRVLAVTQGIMGLTAGALGLLAVTGLVQTWHVYVLAFLFGTGTALDAPARQAFVNEMVDRDQLANAVGLNSAVVQPGPDDRPGARRRADRRDGLGRRGHRLGHPRQRRQLPRRDRVADPDAHRASCVPTARLARAPGQLRDGIRYVRSRPDIMLVMAVVFCAGTFGLNFQMTTALMATEVYGKGAGEYGVLGSILAIGSLLGLADRRPPAGVAAAARDRVGDHLRPRRAGRRADADVPARSPSPCRCAASPR